MTLPPAFGREHAALSVTDGCRRWGGDGTRMPRRAASRWSILLTSQNKLSELGHSQIQIRTHCLFPERGRWYTWVKPQLAPTLGPFHRLDKHIGVTPGPFSPGATRNGSPQP